MIYDATGSKRAKYAPAKDGPFRCDKCRHYTKVESDHGNCAHPEVQKDADDGEVPTDKNGIAYVEAGGCCEYERKR